GEYHLPPEQLSGREHPVTWLRVRLLAERATRAGHPALARGLACAWDVTASGMAAVEDYYGFFEPEFQNEVQQAIDDMLSEAAPRQFAEHEIGDSVLTPAFSPVHLLNQAWHHFWENPEGYRSWEDGAVAAFLGE